MREYVCSVCSYTYDEAKGIPQAGIKPGTKWEDLPDEWVCPICGATKEEFDKQGESALSEKKETKTAIEASADIKELSYLEIGALCTNLARGCEKQYMTQEAVLFEQLADYYKEVSAPAQDSDFDRLLELIGKDMEEGFANANAAASEAKDRGALRALVWSEKVTRILKSLLTRFKKEGDAMLKNTGVYVCTICGFVYIGDTLPEVCPVCKVPNRKFEKVEGR